MGNTLRLYPSALLCAACFSTAVASPLSPSARADEIVIDNAEVLRTGFIAAPLVAIRPITTTAGSIYLSHTNITKDLIVRSATSFPEVEAALASLDISDPSELTMDDLIWVINNSGYGNKYLYKPGSLQSSNSHPNFTTSSYASAHQLAFWDAKTLTNMVVTGVIDTENVIFSTIDDDRIASFRVDEKYADQLNSIGIQAQSLRWRFSPAEIGQKFATLKEEVTSYDALQRSMLENIGEITFGVPVIYTAGEKNLHVPESISKSYDVYWADLVVTYRDINPSDIDEMAFNVAVPDQSVALKIIPLRFGIDVNYSQTYNTPDVAVQYAGAKVSVGEYFSQTVSYRNLKPTIEGYGEGERIFSWKISDSAISGGSHRFAAILRVPKGTKEIDFAFSGHVRLTKGWIGGWYDGEVVAGTDSWIIPVSF